MVYGILRLINFAHGDIFMISCYFGFFAACALLSNAIPTWLTFIATMMVSMLLTALVAVLIERVAYKPLRYAPKVSAVITALGIGLFLENFTLATLGPTPRGMPALLPNVNYRLGALSLSSVQILIIIISIVLMILLDRVVQKTMTGMAMRAVSYDKTTASVMGVPVDRIISITFAIGSAVAGAGGVLYSLAYPWESRSVGGRSLQRSLAASEMSAGPCLARTYWLLLRYSPQWCCRPQLTETSWRLLYSLSCW